MHSYFVARNNKWLPGGYSLYEIEYFLHAMWTKWAPSYVIILMGTRADPGFLAGGFICVEEGVHFADLISFCLNIPGKWNNLVSVTKLFHFHEIFKN